MKKSAKKEAEGSAHKNSEEGMQKSTGGSPYTLSAIKRISSDLREIKKYPLEGVAAEPHEDDMGRWSVFMEGPKGTPFEGGVYELDLQFPVRFSPFFVRVAAGVARRGSSR